MSGAIARLAAILAQAVAPDAGPGTPDLLPRRLVWPGVAVIFIVALFVAAALAGPLIRANSDDPEEDSPRREEPSERP